MGGAPGKAQALAAEVAAMSPVQCRGVLCLRPTIRCHNNSVHSRGTVR